MPSINEVLDQSTTPPLCKTGCGFYVNKETGGFFSSCYKADMLKKKVSSEVPIILEVKNNVDNQKPVENHHQSNKVKEVNRVSLESQKDYLCFKIFSKRAKHVWDELKETYDKVDGFVTFSLHHTLSKNGSSIVGSYHMLNALWKQFDALIELPRCTCHDAGDFKKHNQLMKLMQFIMGHDDTYMQIKSSILSRETLSDVRSDYAIISSEESYRIATGSVSGTSQRSDPSFSRYGTPSSHSGSTSDTHNKNEGGHSLGLDAVSSKNDSFMQNYNMYGMVKIVNELHAMLKLYEETLPKKDANPTPPPPKKYNPAKDAICHQCGKISPSKNKVFVSWNAEFFESKLLDLKASGSVEDLELIQEEDTNPSVDTSLNHEEDDQEIDEPQRDLGELTNYKAALLDPESKKWLDAMNVEMHSMKDNDGFIQAYGVDYEEIFSPVLGIRSIRILIAIAAYYDYEIWQMDVKTAFLNGHLSEEVYMEQPEGFVNPKYPNHNMTSRFQQNLGEEHWTAVKNILEYLRNTKDMFLVYRGNIERELRVLATQTGYVFILNRGAVDWKSIKQSIFATLSTDAEYIAAFYASKEAVWICKFISRLGIVPIIKEPISMYCENTKAIEIAKDVESLKVQNIFAQKFTIFTRPLN
uniref:Ribonuclease H-like domain-containing protein n=1 Tax=Tanacetum cinerariifolium TaxID=118510 RepID=A0A699GHC9_TANCI|nr:ribonuclease H-like domain-containing protein [Tanacetum cinerariifolium]